MLASGGMAGRGQATTKTATARRGRRSRRRRRTDMYASCT
jgi:hypothetical protein